jgi:hypothetical protein
MKATLFALRLNELLGGRVNVGDKFGRFIEYLEFDPRTTIAPFCIGFVIA